jgi:DNA primase large subunit
MMPMPIVSAATLYMDVQKALHIPDLRYSLLNANQIRYAGNEVLYNPFDCDNSAYAGTWKASRLCYGSNTSCGDYPVIYISGA